MICIRNVSKAFDGTPALNGLDMTVQHGSAYGLVGANGAGKTTILKLLMGVLIPDSGDITIEDHPVFDNEVIKRRMALIPDDLAYYGKYTAKGLARIYASLYERWNGALYQYIMDGFYLAGNVSLSRFSKGMQKQTAFALVLAAEPDYLILDEPVDGLDPLAKKIVWYHIQHAITNRQMTVLVSSHNLRELEGICDSVGIIDQGRMLLEKKLGEMRSDIHKLQISFGGESSLSGDVKDSPTPEGAYQGLKIIHMERQGAVDVIIVRESREALERWRDEFRPVLFNPIPLSLEEVFIYEPGGMDYADSSVFQ